MILQICCHRTTEQKQGYFYVAFFRHYQTADTVKYKTFAHFHFANCFLPQQRGKSVFDNSHKQPIKILSATLNLLNSVNNNHSYFFCPFQTQMTVQELNKTSKQTKKIRMHNNKKSFQIQIKKLFCGQKKYLGHLYMFSYYFVVKSSQVFLCPQQGVKQLSLVNRQRKINQLNKI